MTQLDVYIMLCVKYLISGDCFLWLCTFFQKSTESNI